MMIYKPPFYVLALILSGIIIGCSEPPTFETCRQGFYADGIKEDFCIDRTEILVTRIILPDTMRLQHQIPDSLVLKSSSNYLGYLFSFTLEKPTDLSSDGEIAFYHNLQLLMKPGSTHTFNVGEIGGFAFELFDHNGNYFSTELSNQSQPTMKVLYTSLFLDEPNESHEIGNRLHIGVEANGPIYVSNEGGTEERLIEFEYSVTFYISIDQIP